MSVPSLESAERVLAQISLDTIHARRWRLLLRTLGLPADADVSRVTNEYDAMRVALYTVKRQLGMVEVEA